MYDNLRLLFRTPRSSLSDQRLTLTGISKGKEWRRLTLDEGRVLKREEKVDKEREGEGSLRRLSVVLAPNPTPIL